MAYGTVNADVIQSSVSGVSLGAGNASIMKNRIINGAMVIDQRNAGASVTPTDGQYTLDRWKAQLSQTGKFSAQQSTTSPLGFVNSQKFTSLSAYTVSSSDYFNIAQYIEGYNVADLGWGTANAKTVTLSFWVYSSLTGTFGGSIINATNNRSYPFSYSIPVANTWIQASVTIVGDTTGTWATDNTSGPQIRWSLGTGSSRQGTAGAWVSSQIFSVTGEQQIVATNGATFYITGVQLEVGSSATGYEYRPYGTELALCQRYCQQQAGLANSYAPIGFVQMYNTTQGSFTFGMPCPMRVQPSLTTVGTIYVQNANINISSFGGPYGPGTSSNGGSGTLFDCDLTLASAWTSGSVGLIRFNNQSTRSFLLTAEL